MRFQIIRDLKAAGKLHKRLVMRIRMLGVISVILLLIAAYQAFVYGLNIFIDLGIGLAAFLLGFFVFSKMNKVVWDEEQEIISTGRMDIFGFALILVYAGFEIGLRTLLKFEYAGTLAATSYLLVAIGASLLGRTLGTLIAIQKLVHKEGIEA